MKSSFLSALSFLLLGLPFGISQSPDVFAAVKIPVLTGPVIDEVGLLSAKEAQELSEEIQSFLPVAQIQIWILKSLDEGSIEDISIRAVDQWKLGQKGKDNGVLILVAFQDRKMRIEVGRGLEGNIPDALAGRIVDYILRPNFRAEAYAAGLHEAAVEIYRAAGGQPVDIAPPRRASEKLSGPEIVVLFIFIILFAFFFLPLAFFSGFNRRGGGFSHGGGWGSGTGWGGGGGFSGRGWSGGGGGFSGGGSSGSW